MSVYIQRDIQQYDDGELDLSGGDLTVAGVRQSQRQLLITLLNTTRGDFKYDREVGWGCEKYIGRRNEPIVHQTMKQDLGLSFNVSEDIAKEDLDWVVWYVSENEVGITVRHSGMFLEPDGTTPDTTLALGWKLSFETGQIETVE